MSTQLIFCASVGIGMLGSLAFFAATHQTSFQKRVQSVWDLFHKSLGEEKNLIAAIADLQGKIYPLKKQLGLELVNFGDQFSNEDLIAQIPEIKSELQTMTTYAQIDECIESINERIQSLSSQKEKCESIYTSLTQRVQEIQRQALPS